MTNLIPMPALRLRKGLKQCDRGATAIEYGLILALIAVTIIGALSMTATKTINMWSNVSNAVVNAG